MKLDRFCRQIKTKGPDLRDSPIYQKDHHSSSNFPFLLSSIPHDNKKNYNLMHTQTGRQISKESFMLVVEDIFAQHAHEMTLLSLGTPPRRSTLAAAAGGGAGGGEEEEQQQQPIVLQSFYTLPYLFVAFLHQRDCLALAATQKVQKHQHHHHLRLECHDMTK